MTNSHDIKVFVYIKNIGAFLRHPKTNAYTSSSTIDVDNNFMAIFVDHNLHLNDNFLASLQTPVTEWLNKTEDHASEFPSLVSMIQQKAREGCERKNSRPRNRPNGNYRKTSGNNTSRVENARERKSTFNGNG